MSLVKVSQGGSGGGGSGTVTSVGLSVPQPVSAAFTVSNSPIIASGTIAISANGASNQYVDGTGALQNSVAFTDVGTSIATLTNPLAVSYLQINANNSVTPLTAAQLKTALGFIAQIQSTTLNNSSSSVAVNIDGCIVALAANSTYIGKMTIASGSPSTAGFPLTLTFPTGTTINVGRINTGATVNAQVMQWQGSTSGTALGTNFGTAQNQIGYAELQLYIAVGANAGNLTPSFVSGSNGSNTTIYLGLTSIQLQKL